VAQYPPKGRDNRLTAPSPGLMVWTEMPPMVYGRGGDKQRGKGVYTGRGEEIQTRSADLSGFLSPDLRLVPVPASLNFYLVPCTAIPSTIASC